MQKFVAQDWNKKLARCERPQRLRRNPVSLSERSHPSWGERRIAKGGRRAERAKCNRSITTQPGARFRLGKCLRQLRQELRIGRSQCLKHKPLAAQALPRDSGRLVRHRCAGKVLRKYLAGISPQRRHGRRTCLAQAHAVSRSASVKKKLIALLRNLKPGAEYPVPAHRPANREAKILRGNLSGSHPQR